ncbi:MAG: transcriptional regulator [Dehalococcoidia bacterium]|nr:transcriptional regulator [Dehalococcoidia bacterium]
MGAIHADPKAAVTMPRYLYRCPNCALQYITRRIIADADNESCVSCGTPMDRIFTPPAISFKGDGWGGTHPN